MILTWSRKPASRSASTVACILGIVVVKQGRHGNDIGLVFGGSLDESLRLDVDAEVDHLEPRTLQHHRHQILADVVDVALDRADHDRAGARASLPGQQRLQDSIAPVIAADMSTSGMNISPLLKSWPTTSMPGSKP